MLLSSFSSFWTSKLSNDSLMKRLCGLADSWRDDELSHLISMVHVFLLIIIQPNVYTYEILQKLSWSEHNHVV